MMKSIMAKNIARLRKEKGYTQEKLASLMQVSAQAISKWENEQSYPDIELLPRLTDILETNIDSLIGHIPGDSRKTIYSEVYEDNGFYWGLQPDSLCFDVLRLYPPSGHVKILEIGCGEGKDALFFARNGYNVTAFDIAQSAINKVQRLADQYKVYIKAFRAEMKEYRLEEDYDIIFSSRALHHLHPDFRSEIIADYQKHTKPNGLHALNVYIRKPFIGPPPEKDDFAYLWRTGEIFSLYADWNLQRIDEIIYDCFSSGIPHKHVMDILVAQNSRELL